MTLQKLPIKDIKFATKLLDNLPYFISNMKSKVHKKRNKYPFYRNNTLIKCVHCGREFCGIKNLHNHEHSYKNKDVFSNHL